MSVTVPPSRTLNRPVASPRQGVADDSNWARPDNRFVPVRACDLARELTADAARFGVSTQSVADFAKALEDVIDHETGLFGRRLTDAYARFNPDRDTQPMSGQGPASPAEYELLDTQLAFLLEKANYEELTDIQIAQAVMKARTRNLTVRVDPSRVEFLRIWVRGRGETTRQKRRRWRPWQTDEVRVPLFKRLVVIVRLKDDPHVILKLFKDIPESDAEALFPHAEVLMSLWDRIKLLGSSAGTLGITVSKLLKIAIGLAALWKLAWILSIGLVTIIIRTVLGYRNARINRNWQRTQHLYFQNLGNNASALQLLVAKVKQEEFKEALLGYLFWQAADSGAHDQAVRCAAIEQYLREKLDAQVDFDIQDADDKLSKLGLCTTGSPTAVLPIDQATETLRNVLGEHGSATHFLECEA